METLKPIEVLNTLIEINNDRIDVYETASQETDDVDIKLLFSQFIQTSKRCKAALSEEVHSIGGLITEGTRLASKFYKVWMDVKNVLIGNDRKTILDSCEYGEHIFLATYDNALKNNAKDITAVQYEIIFAQQILIQADYTKINNMIAAKV